MRLDYLQMVRIWDIGIERETAQMRPCYTSRHVGDGGRT